MLRHMLAACTFPFVALILETVTEFQYLGSIFIADNTIDKEVNPRLAKAGYAWHTLWWQQSGQMFNCL